MVKRLFHSLISFVVVFVLFAMYRFLLAPLMLPEQVEKIVRPEAVDVAATALLVECPSGRERAAVILRICAVHAPEHEGAGGDVDLGGA